MMYKEETSSPPSFNTVKVEILTNNTFETCHANAREPIPFETEFFKGVTFIVIRTDPYDPPYEHFFIGRRRLFEVQVQGKFRRMPKGEVYVGAEAGNKLELGLITRSIAKAAISLAGTMASNLHSSLGDMKDKELYQLPHVVAPIFTTFDKIIVTPEGETPPPLGSPFIEDLEYRKQRLKFHKIKDANISLTSTYSFSVNTSNINLINWTLVGIPMVRPMDLRIFLADSPIRLVGYEIPDSVLTGPNKTNDHPIKELNYVFNMKLTSVDPNTEREVDLPTHSGSEDEGDELQEENEELTSADRSRSNTAVDLEGNRSRSDTAVGGEEVAQAETNQAIKKLLEDNDYLSPNEQSDDDDADVEFSAKTSAEIVANTDDRKARRRSTVGKALRGWIKKRMSIAGPKSPNEVTATADLAEADGAAEVTESTEEYTLTEYELESTGDLRFCPGSVETFKEGHRRVYYFIPVVYSPSSNNMSGSSSPIPVTTGSSHLLPNTHTTSSEALIVDSEFSSDDIKLRPYSEIAKSIPMLAIPRMHKNRRLSTVEKRRRQIVESYSQLLSKQTVDSNNINTTLTKFTSSLSQIQNADKEFLDGNASVNECQINKTKAFQGSVAIASSRRHWVEYSMILTKRDVFFYKQQKSSKSSSNNGSIKTSRRHEMRIRMFDVVSVQPLCYHDIPILGFSFFQIETFSRVYYCMVRSDTQVSEWIQAFVFFLGQNILISHFDDDPEIESGITISGSKIDLEGDAYLAKSGCWKLDKKRILNYRRISFNPNAQDSSVKKLNFYFPTRTIDSNTFIESILSDILYISQPEINKVTPSHWVSFMNKISYLQTINISHLTEIERAAFFLNLYHIMVIHGSLVVGSPPAWNHWNAFFNNITYLFSYEIISISDVEHNILRAAMTRPSSLSIIPIPNHRFPGLALTHKDFRLNFCINNGSKSMPRMIPIYKPEKLDEQLDEMTKLMLLKNTEVDQHRKIITLPKALLQDFIITNTNQSNNMNNSNSSNSNTTTNNIIQNNNLNHSQQSKECIRVLLSYFSKDDRDYVARALVENIHLNVKFKNHNLRCRKLCLYNPTSANYFAYIDKISNVKTSHVNENKDINDLTINDKLENNTES